MAQVNLCGGGPCKREAAKNRSQDVRHVIGWTNIAGARCERGHPHFFVRDPVRADDGQGWKVAVQTLDLGQVPTLDVQNHGLRTFPGHVFPQFLAGLGYVHGKMRSKSTGQGPRHSRILLEDHYTLRHTYPDLQPSSTGETVDLTRAAGWPEEPQLHRHLKLSNRGQKSAHLPACRRLFCQRFEWFSLKLPVLLQQDLDFAFRLFQFLAAG